MYVWCLDRCTITYRYNPEGSATNPPNCITLTSDFIRIDDWFCLHATRYNIRFSNWFYDLSLFDDKMSKFVFTPRHDIHNFLCAYLHVKIAILKNWNLIRWLINKLHQTAQRQINFNDALRWWLVPTLFWRYVLVFRF